MGQTRSSTRDSVASASRVLFGVATLTLALSVWFNGAVHDPRAVGPSVEGLLSAAATVDVVLAETAEAVGAATGVPPGPVHDALAAAWETAAADETRSRLAAAVVGAAAAQGDDSLIDLTPAMRPLVHVATGEMSPGGVPAPEEMVDAFLTDVGSAVVIVDAHRVPLVDGIAGAQAASSIVLGTSMMIAMASALLSLALAADRPKRLLGISITFGLVQVGAAVGLWSLAQLLPQMIGSADLAAGVAVALGDHLEAVVVLGAVALLVAASRRLGFEPPRPMVVVIGEEPEHRPPAMAGVRRERDPIT